MTAPRDAAVEPLGYKPPVHRVKPLVLMLVLAAAPVSAQQAEDGTSLMERGAQMFLDGLMRQVEPALRQMEPALQDFLSRMGPALVDLLSRVDDLSRYAPPEMLPNGDIILRRKPDPAPPLKPGEIDL